MHKSTYLVLAVLIASVSAGCEYHHDIQEVIAPPHETEAVSREEASEASSDIVPDLSKEMRDLQNKIDELERQIEEQKEILISQEEEIPTGPTAEETPAPPIPETPEEPAGNPSDEPTTEGPTTTKPVAINPDAIGNAVSTVLNMDHTAPKVVLVISPENDAKTYTIVFNEAVDFQSIAANLSIGLYKPSVGYPVPVKGSLYADETSPKMVKFIADDPLVYERNFQGDPLETVYIMKIFGADSSNPSRAVKDKAGNAMAAQVDWELHCVDTPEYFALTQTHCE